MDHIINIHYLVENDNIIKIYELLKIDQDNEYNYEYNETINDYNDEYIYINYMFIDDIE